MHNAWVKQLWASSLALSGSVNQRLRMGFRHNPRVGLRLARCVMTPCATSPRIRMGSCARIARFNVCFFISNVPPRYKSEKSVNCWEVLTGRLLFQGSQGSPCHQTKHAWSVVISKQPRWTTESGWCQMGFLDIFSLWCDSEVCIYII